MSEASNGNETSAAPIVAEGDDGRRYRIVEKLGQGGFGTVYRAWAEDHAGVSRQVAIKVLKEDVPDEVVVRFRDEARMLGLVQHRAIVGLEGLVRMEGQLSAVLEYVAGVDLKSVIETKLPPLRVAMRLVEEVASALHAAYAQPNELTGRPLRLVHRDIKPANIRVTPGGEVRVVDFGGARADFADREAQTRSFVVGSYRYMAPERLDLVDSPRSDVYSLGLVFAELLVGTEEVPTPSKHAAQHESFLQELLEVVSARLGEEDLPEAVVEALVQLVRTMLDYYPQRRPTAREVEQQARVLLREIPGPFLREWAEGAVPALEQAHRSEVTPVPHRRSLFPRSGEDSLLPAERQPSQSQPSGGPSGRHLGATPLAPPGRTLSADALVPPQSQGWSAHERDPLADDSTLPRRSASRGPVAPSRPPPLEWVVLAAVGALLLSGLITNQVRHVERAPPVAAPFRAAAPLPAPVRAWGPAASPETARAGGPGHVGNIAEAAAEPPADPAAGEAASEQGGDEKRGLFRFPKKKKR